MGPLESILARVEGLREDLSAEIVIREEQEETGYWTEVGRNHTQVLGEDLWVVTHPRIARIAKPDTEKQQAAKQELQQIYDNSEWYSTRYAAGRAIDVGEQELSDNVDLGIYEFEKQLQATKTVQKKIVVGSHEEEPDYGSPPSGHDDNRGGPYIGRSETVSDYEWKPFELIDLRKRCDAVQDACALWGLSSSKKVKTFLKEVYNGSYNYSLDSGVGDVDCDGNAVGKTRSSVVRKEAGRALGHSELRIWAHQHPLVVTIGALSGAAAATYIAIQYLSN